MAALKIAGNLELEREAKRTKNPPLTAEERERGIMEILNRARARRPVIANRFLQSNQHNQFLATGRHLYGAGSFAA